MKKTNNRILECYLCHTVFKFNKMSNLRRHIRLHDPRVKYFGCLECGKKFQNKSNFKNHWKKIHSLLAEANVLPKMFTTSRETKSK